MPPHATLPPLLHAAEQLADAWWRESIMELLWEDEGALANTAISCKQFREMCHNGALRPRLSGRVLQDAAIVARIPARFPAFTKLAAQLTSSEDLACHLPTALRALTGMTSLHAFTLEVQDSGASNNAAAMVQALQSIRQLMETVQQAQAAAPTAAVMRAPADDEVLAHQLELSVKGEWVANEQVWQAIGQLPQLQWVHFHWDSCEVATSPCYLSALAPWARTLQGLRMSQHDWPQEAPTIDYSILGAFKQLRVLTLQLPASWVDLHSISSCASFCNLSLSAQEREVQGLALDASECAAVGQLTTRQLAAFPELEQHNDAWSFLSGLQQLQKLRVLALPHAALGALARLKQLEDLSCIWQHEEQQLAAGWYCSVRCPSVRVLDARGGTPPFWAFPALEELNQSDQWEAAAFESAAMHCRQLVQLTVQQVSYAWWRGSFAASAPAAARTAALERLSPLHRLQHLQLSVCSRAEVAALADFQHLQELVLVIPGGTACTARDLVLLAALRQLEVLQLELPGQPTSDWTGNAMHLLLSSICGPLQEALSSRLETTSGRPWRRALWMLSVRCATKDWCLALVQSSAWALCVVEVTTMALTRFLSLMWVVPDMAMAVAAVVVLKVL